MAETVIAPGNLVPGVGLRVDLAVSDLSTIGLNRRICVIAAISGAGTAVADAVNLSVGGPGRVAELGGNGSLGHLCAKAVFKEHPTARMDFVGVAEPGAGVAASQTVTFDDTTPVTVAKTVNLNIMGRDFSLDWQPAETDIAFATRFVALINGADADLYVTAANGGGTLAAMALTAKNKGTQGNDVLLALSTVGGTGGAVTLGGASLAAGTGVLDCTAALAAISGTQYDLIVICNSNADAVAASTTGLVGKLKTHMETYISGFNALLQQAIIGVTGLLSSAKVGPATHNYGLFQYIFCRSGRSLPCEWAGAEAGARLREEQKDPNVNRANRVDKPYSAVLYGPADLTTGTLLYVEEQDALVSGLSPVKYTAAGTPLVSVPRTAYWKDVFANEDRRLVYVSQPTTLFEIAKDLRVYLPSRFPGAKITPDTFEGDDDAPPNVIEVGTVRAVVISRMREHVGKGWIVGSALDEADANGTLVCEIDSSNTSKLNIQLPLTMVPPLTQYDIVLQGVTR